MSSSGRIMEKTDDDTKMLDASQPASAKIGLMNGASGVSAASVIPNGMKSLRRLSMSPPPSLKQLKQVSREASVLATDVADQLSLGSSGNASVATDASSEELTSSVAPWPRPNPPKLLRTGLCYDVRMRYHCELDPPKQRDDIHPEDPRRIFHIYHELCLAGLVEDPSSIKPLVDKPLLRIVARSAMPAEICLVHTRPHYDFVESTRDMSDDVLIHMQHQYDSIYFNKLTFATALLSAGGAIDTCRAVAGGQLKNAIAVIRPPGHHAECNRPMGFCLFDNVSIAVRVCQQDLRDSCRKVLIVDWDVHHGNGIQQAFYQDPNVLYISIHVHENGEFYPSGPYGDHLHCGAEPGLGKNINIPWPTKGMGDADYLFAFQHVVMPVAYDFNPDLVVIAAGFDAAAGDQLGGCFVSPKCYAHMTHMLMSLAGGKLVVCLEGGYNLDSISKSALAVTRTLMGEPPDRLRETSATISGIATVQKVALIQSKYWHCLYPKDTDKGVGERFGVERMHDIVRSYQSGQLYGDHKMTSLWIYHDRLSKSFKDQVIATPNYHKAIPLLVILHDPPPVFTVLQPGTQRLDLHNIYLADLSKHYIKWAIDQGWAVIDVNIPTHITGFERGIDHQEEDKVKRTIETEEIAIYLWENYIECNDATEIFFMGVGACYHAILHLLVNRESFRERLTATVNFVAENLLLPINDQNIYNLAKWYYNNSLIFVTANHAVWDPERQRRPSKRFGQLVRSPEKEMDRMLQVHRDEVGIFFRKKVGAGFGRGRGEGGKGRVLGMGM